MKSIILIFSLILLSFQKGSDEIAAVEGLIHISERQLSVQTRLKDLITEFKAQQDLFLQGAPSKEHATKMVQTAAEILNIIQEHNYAHLFSSIFLHELQLFTSIATKKTPGKP